MKRVFGRMMVRHKLLTIGVVSFVGCFLVLGLALLALEQNLLEDRKQKLRELVEVAHSQVGHYYQLAQAGTISSDAAQRQARAAVAGMRYNQGDYFWINDMQPRMVMHPIKPSLDGKLLSGFKDPSQGDGLE